MNEFEWLRETRDLNQPVEPRNDLWARIDAALDDAPPIATPLSAPIKRAPRQQIWGLAASIAAMVVLTGSIVWRVHTAAPINASTWANANALHIDNAPWKPNDPRLAGAAVELGAARIELQQAIEQAPDSPALQRLLQRTNDQQAQLRNLEKQAG
jgi:hypothetical protein